MKKFEFVEFFYDAVKDMTREQKGDFLDVLCEYYFNGKTSFSVGEMVVGAANACINYNRKQQQEKQNDFEQVKQWSKDVLDWCKTKCDWCMQVIKTCGQVQLDGLIEECSNDLNYIPREQIEKSFDWIRNKYDEKYYL